MLELLEVQPILAAALASMLRGGPESSSKLDDLGLSLPQQGLCCVASLTRLEIRNLEYRSDHVSESRGGIVGKVQLQYVWYS